MRQIENPSGREGLGGTANGCNDEPNVPRPRDIYNEIATTLHRIDQKLTGSFCQDSKSAVVLLRGEVPHAF